MNDACNHKCARVKESEETIEMKLLKTISELKRGLKATAWYKRSESRAIKLEIRGLNTKRSYR